MAKTIVGIRFKRVGKIYYFDPKDLDLQQFDKVVVETSRGIELGEVALAPREVPEEQLEAPIKDVLRIATDKDIATYDSLKIKEKEAWEVFNEKVKLHALDMKLIDVEYTFDKRKAIFYFTAEGRVDFRELVKDLASVFKIRIELHQIGVRDEAKLFRGLGICGRTTCCAEWLGDFMPVSIKMAKEQNLSLNSTKISGICGRLLCCLNYEHEFYAEVTKKMPKVGQHVSTPDGEGDVFKLSILDEAVYVRVTLSDDETEVRKFTLDQIERKARTDQPGNGPRQTKTTKEEPRRREKKVAKAAPEEKKEKTEQKKTENRDQQQPQRRNRRRSRKKKQS